MAASEQVAAAAAQGSEGRAPGAHLARGQSLLVLFVHSLFYDGFFDNPITWGVLGLGAALASGAPRGVAHRPPPRRRASPAAAGEPADRHPTFQSVPSGG